MSTKNLARTVIEGGRYGSNKYDRRQSSATERVHARQYCKQVVNDPELAEEEFIESREPVGKGFTDKLAPMYRWLDAQDGRLWSEVRSEVFQNFDTRTTAGRHITFDHLLSEVVDTESGFDKYGRIVDPSIPKEDGPYHGYYSPATYYVDQEGVFHKASKRRAWRNAYRSKHERINEQDCAEAGRWLNNRMIKEVDGKYYWLMATAGVWKVEWVKKESFYASSYFDAELKYLLLKNGEFEERHESKLFASSDRIYYTTVKTHGDYWEAIENPFSFRQRGELLPEDLKIFKSLKDRLQRDILSFTKNR